MQIPYKSHTDRPIGILRTSAIGDVVLATTALERASQLGILDQIFFITRGPSLALLRDFYPEVPILDMDAIEQAIVENLLNPKLILDLQGNLRSRRFCMTMRWKTGCRIVRHHKNSAFRRMLVLMARLRGRQRPTPASVLSCQVPLYLRVATSFDLATKPWVEARTPGNTIANSHRNARPRLPIHLSMFHDPYFKRWRQKNYLALAPGASYQAKRVPLAIWVAILRGITSSLASDLEVVLLGDDKDATIASELHQAILDQRLLGVTISNECGQLSLTQSAMVLANCRGLLTNDSSLGHICEAVGRPVATLFGPTCEGFGFVPHLEASGAFSTDEIGCRPCSVHGQSPCRYKDYACFHRIDLQPIVEKVYTWLS